MNGHKSDFRLYAAGKINKMDNKLRYDHLICHSVDYLHVCIVDMIHVGNNTESQHEELLSRKERKWVWDLGSITPYGQNQDDGFYRQNKRCINRYVRSRTLRLFMRPWSTMECSQPAAWTTNRSLLVASRVRPFQEDRQIPARPYPELRTWMVVRSGVISVFPTHSGNAPASPDVRPTTWLCPAC